MEDLQELINDFAGYCTHCEDVTNESGVEGDAEGYQCDCCGNFTVMGIENAILMGHFN